MVAWAAPCPNVDSALQGAERDALSFFLADAQGELNQAAEGLGCQEVPASTLARYWLAQAMVWHLQERPADADAALAAAKVADGAVFTDDLGDELRELWASTEVPVGETVRIKIRGMKRSDGLRIDTVEMPEAVVVPGLHLVQVLRDGEVVFGKVADVGADGLELVMGASTPEPVVGPVAAGPTNTFLPEVQGPLAVKGNRILDGQGAGVPFHGAVLPLSMVAEGGVANWTERRRNGRLQGVALGTAAVGGWVGYLFAWDRFVGENLDEGASTVLMTSGILMASTGLVWEGVLLGKRRANRKRAVELANTTLGAP